MENVGIPILAGFITGFLIGLTGMGGGALMTPFLILWLKLDPVLAVGTDLMFAAITKVGGSLQHRREDNINVKDVFWMACGSMPAAFIAGRFLLRQTDNRHLIEDLLPQGLGIVLMVVGTIIMARVLGVLRRKKTAEPRLPSPISLVLIGVVGGVLVGLTSVGGGTVIMGLLLIFFAIPPQRMVGLDVMHGALLAGTAALTYATAGQTNWRLVLLLLSGSLPGVWLGARTTSRSNPRLIRAGLAILILGAGFDLLVG